ncbi:peptidoglycan-binding protein [Actinopolymorpha alba]|uniref:peptidoglycan-binding protein n=1 Tax=Actinopolymorpha alba TaxID=533267 RepID=UPI000369E9D5|nr:peptidoglycan-binding protein [Actinopolymorpha alba]
MARPMLGDLELEQVQLVEVDEDQVVLRHPVPGLEGDFLQDFGRRAARVRLTGVLTAVDTVEHLGTLREKFHAGEPVGFVSDITSATLVDQVLIERMDVVELAGRPRVFEYRFDLREFLEAAPVDTEDVVIPPPPPPDVENGKLAVTVVVEGDPAFDMDRVRVTVRGTEQKTGADLTRVLTNRTSPNVWFADPFPAGDYTAEALVDDHQTPTGQREVLTGSAAVHVDDGQVASVTITLRRGAKIGTVFAITFHFDKAFVEPCMRHVLQQVAEYAAAHADERLLVVGHTDLVGPPTYNQALSERRARATYAMMTFGSDLQRSTAEWNELRRARPAGTINTVRDTWGTREIQHMLQDLGLYKGNVGVTNGEDATLTDAAIRTFQRDHGLAEDGIVGDDTWPVLIETYLGQEPIALDTGQLMANRNDAGCDSGPLRWLGCSEQDPVLNTEDAWRPNRRTELMFVHESTMPCQVPKPATLDQVPDGAGGGGWCLDDGTATVVDGFVVPWGTACPTGSPDPHRPWCRQPAEPGSFLVKGAIHFEDGTPFQGTYVLIAADGEYLDGEVPKTAGATHAGTPVPGRTQADGTFAYAKQKGPGTFTIAVDGPIVVSAGQALEDVKGNAVCFRLTGEGDADIVVVDRAVAFVQPSIVVPDGPVLDQPPQPAPPQPPPPQPTVTAKDAVVVVRKPYTNPARRPVVLKVSTAFKGSGTFTVSKAGSIRFFDAVTAGNAVASGTVFTSDQLVAGVTVFAEGAKASDKVGDVVLKLSLIVDGKKGLSATKPMTAVELFLDIHQSRTSTTRAPAPLAAAQKVNPGRFVHVQDAGFHHGRAMLTVRPPKPSDFKGALVLQALDAKDANPRERLFAAGFEVAAAGQASLGASTKPTVPIPAAGTTFWVEGVRVSAAQHDSGFQLGIDGVEPDGDRVALTVVQFSNLRATIPGTPPNTARLGNALPAGHVFTVGANGFDEDPTVNTPLPLVENSVVPAAPVVLTVQVAPAGTPVRWDAMRAAGVPAASGGDDAASIVALHAAKKPTITRTPGNDLRATLLTDNTGTFHLRPFVDCNGNNTFDYHIDREPSMVLNLVLGRATLFLDSSIPHNNFVAAGTVGGGISMSSGAFDIANPGTAAVHLNAQVDVVTGGADGRRVIDQFFAGWFNNVVGPALFTQTYTDPTPPGAVHVEPFVFASNGAAATGPGREFVPGDPAPVLVAPPILDSGRATPGTGGDTAALSTSRIRGRTPRPVGQRWIVEAVDSPGVPPGLVGGTHPVVGAARLTGFVTRLRFTCYLNLWTNTSRASGASGHPADRQYAVLERVVWQIDGRWSINPATGAVAIVTNPATVISNQVKTSPAVAVARTREEVRPPAAVPLAVKDARA